MPIDSVAAPSRCRCDEHALTVVRRLVRYLGREPLSAGGLGAPTS
ncbi:hypothetical protein AB0D34_19845 [Streptomyces sp. NPDC048420]